MIAHLTRFNQTELQQIRPQQTRRQQTEPKPRSDTALADLRPCTSVIAKKSVTEKHPHILSNYLGLGCLLILLLLTMQVKAENSAVANPLAVISQPITAPSTSTSATPVKEISAAKTVIAKPTASAIAVADLPSLNQPIIDTAKVLSATEMQSLSQQILALRQQQHIQMGVVIVNTTGEQPIFDYALQVAERWKLGAKGQDDGLLMVIAVQDKRIQILTGYGLEGVLPDIVVGRIIRDNISPAFKQQQYAQGIENAISRISSIVQADAKTQSTNTNHPSAQNKGDAQVSSPLQQALFLMLIVLLVAGGMSYFIKPITSAWYAAPVAAGLGLYCNAGILPSIAIGLGVFILVATTFAQIILQIGLQLLLSGGRSGGSSGGGGYSGGGGGFGGGGASGSW